MSISCRWRHPFFLQYMVAGGLSGSADCFASPTHVADLAQLALAMRDVASRFSIGGQPLEVLGGIHVGRISAGVIGQTLPRYRCFGDTARCYSAGGCRFYKCVLVFSTFLPALYSMPLEPSSRFSLNLAFPQQSPFD